MCISLVHSTISLSRVKDSTDSDSGAEWYTNQNNFFRQVRNFVIDISHVSSQTKTSCVHWQVAQASSLHNIHFQMRRGGQTNEQTGIFMDNGSGG
jgi:glucan 1,3-beta-glucosidase